MRLMGDNMNLKEKKNIIFFDGHCNLCNESVDLLIKFDKKNKFFFAPISGVTAKSFGVFKDVSAEKLSVAYLRGEKQIFLYSDAVIEIVVDLFLLGKLFYLFKIFPRFFRDSIYMVIARNRYKIFGKKETCRIPTEEEKGRFIS